MISSTLKMYFIIQSTRSPLSIDKPSSNVIYIQNADRESLRLTTHRLERLGTKDSLSQDSFPPFLYFNCAANLHRPFLL